jgi:hypothetical protein
LKFFFRTRNDYLLNARGSQSLVTSEMKQFPKYKHIYLVYILQVKPRVIIRCLQYPLPSECVCCTDCFTHAFQYQPSQISFRFSCNPPPRWASVSFDEFVTVLLRLRLIIKNGVFDVSSTLFFCFLSPPSYCGCRLVQRSPTDCGVSLCVIS